MRYVQKLLLSAVLLLGLINTSAGVALNTPPGYTITVINEATQPLENATVELWQGGALVKALITDEKGIAGFENVAPGTYTFSITHTGYEKQTTGVISFPSPEASSTIILKPVPPALREVAVTGKKQFVTHTQGKTILNVEAAVTNVGTSVLEVLEKSPGVTVDRNGGIALQGKPGVLVLIDDKPTYLSGAELNNLLSSMSSAQVELIELITNPPARYDASGNAGIINIKTKKNRARGFNGSFNVTASQGVYPKNNNNISLNYRAGRLNGFVTYGMNLTKYLTDIYALRKYYDDNGALTAVLDQPTYFSGLVVNHTVKTGVDYYISPKTTAGIVLGVTYIRRNGGNLASATWLNAANTIDSAISTRSTSNSSFRNGSLNLNLRHSFDAAREIMVHLDWLRYDIRSEQYFNNELLSPGGYREASRGNIPSFITILSGKVDHTWHMGKNTSFGSGWKSSHISTDNIASYQAGNDSGWREDYGKSNHFLYRENIHALYSSLETKFERFTLQAGIRYEHTGYNAHQLGNSVQKDSAFSRRYDALFPSGSLGYQADSSNSFTFTAGRRIDRPAFQALNPFFFIINKYTYETGNPFFLPQYSLNLEFGHQFKELLNTTFSYSSIKDYFSQLFLTDTDRGILLYSQGNVGKAYNLGLSSTLTVSPFTWWSLNLQATFNHKRLKGFNGSLPYTSGINQLNLNCSNQFTFAKVFAGEISGFYTTRARNDLQELLYPTGQLSLGISRMALKNKGTIKLSARDIFYTSVMEGLTQFARATEYFILRRDSRVVNLSFTYRFGQAYKTGRRAAGSAEEEIERVGSGR